MHGLPMETIYNSYLAIIFFVFSHEDLHHSPFEKYSLESIFIYTKLLSQMS